MTDNHFKFLRAFRDAKDANQLLVLQKEYREALAKEAEERRIQDEKDEIYYPARFEIYLTYKWPKVFMDMFNDERFEMVRADLDFFFNGRIDRAEKYPESYALYQGICAELDHLRD